MPEELDENFLYSPYVAMIVDKDEAGQRQFFERFYRLDQPTKDILTSPQTTSYIRHIFETGMSSEEYATAVAKIVAYAAMGEVPIPSVPQLLMKIGLSNQEAQRLAREIERILEPLSVEKAKAVRPKLESLPPLTRPTESGPRPVAGQSSPKRNIIDLRPDRAGKQPNA